MPRAATKKREPAPENKVYQLPGPVVAALSSNRPELLKIFMTQLWNSGKEVQEIRTEHFAGLLELLSDLMVDRDHDRTELKRLRHMIGESIGVLDTGLRTQLVKLIAGMIEGLEEQA